MIPTMIVVGLLVGPLCLPRATRPHGVLVAALATVAWGVAVAALDGWSAATFVGGAWLAVANLLVGAVVAVALVTVLHTARRLAPRP